MDILLIEVFNSPDLKNSKQNIIFKVGPKSLKLVGSNFFTRFQVFTNGHISVKIAKKEKCEVTLSYQTFKVEKGKVFLLFTFLTILTDILELNVRDMDILLKS